MESGATKELKRLNPFVGKWKTTGEIKGTKEKPAQRINGTDTYKWLKDGYFMLHTVDVRMGSEQIDSIEVIGFDKSTNTYPMHYFGHQGATGLMHASVDGSEWKFTGDTERFIGSFNKSGNVIEGKWERREKNKWIDWMKVSLTKVD